MIIYILYNKIFSNKILSRLIYSFVRFEHYNHYINSESSFRIQDATIQKMLSNNLFTLFDDYIDFYFKVAKYNKVKYWYHLNSFSNISTEDIELILKSCGKLTLDRFKLIYNEFEDDFTNSPNINLFLMYSASTGNFEIYNYLKEIGYSNFPNNWLTVQNGYNNKKLIISLGGGREITFECINCIFESGGNFEIFKDLFNHFNGVNGNLLSDLQIKSLLLYLVDKNYREQYKHLIDLYPYILTTKFLMAVSIRHSSYDLACYLVNQVGIFGKSFNFGDCFREIKSIIFYDLGYKSPIENKQENLGSSINFGVALYYYNSFIKSIFDLKNSSSNFNQKEFKREFINYVATSPIKDFSFELVNYDLDIIETQMKLRHYIPKSLKEFTYILENRIELLNQCTKAYTDIDNYLIYISTQLFDHQYLNEFIKYLSSKFIVFSFPTLCYDSKFEIIQCLYENKLSSSFFQDRLIKFSPKKAFYGDNKSAEFYLKLFQHQQIDSSYFIDCLYRYSIQNGYYDITSLLLNSFYSTLPKLSILDEIFYGLGKNQIVQAIINHSKENNIQLNLDLSFDSEEFLYYLKHKKLFLHLLVSNGYYKEVLNSLHNKIISKGDFSLFKWYSSIRKDSIRSKFDLYQLYCYNSNIKILDYMVNSLNYKPSRFTHISRNNLKSIIIINCYGSNLNYLIDNDPEFFICNYKSLITTSTLRENSYYLNYIFLNQNFNNNFKLSLFIKTIIFAIPISLKSHSIWIFGIINNNILKEDIKQYIINNLALYNSSSKCLISLRQLNSIQRFYQLYIKSKTQYFKDENLNVFLTIKYILKINNQLYN